MPWFGKLSILGVKQLTGSTLVFASKSLFEAETEEGSKAPYSMYVPDLRMEATTLGDILPPMASMAPHAILPPAKQGSMSNFVHTRVRRFSPCLMLIMHQAFSC